MPKSDTWFTMDKKAPKHAYLLEMIKQAGSLRKLAKKLEISPASLSSALNLRYIAVRLKIKIAKALNKDSREIWP